MGSDLSFRFLTLFCPKAKFDFEFRFFGKMGNITDSTNSTMNLVNSTDQQVPDSLIDLDAQSQNATDLKNSTISISDLEKLRKSLEAEIEFSWTSYRRFSSFRFDMVICLTVLFLVVFLILCCVSGIDKRNSELELREARLRARVQMLEQIHKQV